MRLWLPEKASARLSIKGFVGAGCIFPRHCVDVSQARRCYYQGTLHTTARKLYTAQSVFDERYKNNREGDAWLSIVPTFLHV